MLFNRVLLLTTITICLFQISSAVICYKCQSTHDVDCADPIKTTEAAVINCTGSPIPRRLHGARRTEKCSKIVREDKMKGLVIIERSCFYESETLDKCMLQPGSRAEYKVCEVCEGELCNKSPTNHLPSPFTIASILLPILIAHIL